MWARIETSAWTGWLCRRRLRTLAWCLGLLGVVAVVDDYGCAFAGEADGDGLADARAGAGDDGDFVLQAGMGVSSAECLFEMQYRSLGRVS